MKRLILICLFSLIVFSCKESKNENLEKISSNDLKVLIESKKDFQIIDIRTAKEYNSGYIKGAKNIDFYSESFSSDINSLNKEIPVVVYCHSGGRSEKGVKMFKESGFLKIYDLHGGIKDFRNKGFLIENK